MSHDEVIEMMDEMEIPYAYDHFAEGESPDPPFICFLYPETRNFAADNRVYNKIKQLDIELYTDVKDPNLEEQVEEVLEEHELYWDATEVWIESERLYEVDYTVMV